MKLINFKRDQDWGQDFYLQILFTKRWAFFQGSVSWCKYPGWPFLQIQSGSGSLLSIIYDLIKEYDPAPWLDISYDAFKSTSDPK